MNKILAITTLLLVGCTPADPTMHMQNEQEQYARAAGVKQDHRVSVTRIDVFKDSIAYQEIRGVYLIKDRVTGKEFVGISGIGITEVGSHKQGKTTVSDER